MMHTYGKLPLRKAILIIGIGLLSIPLSAQFTITESFKGNSVGNSNIILGGKDGHNAYLTSGNVDPAGEGWLRLTEAETNRAGYAYLNSTFPSSLGVYIDFEYKAWRNKDDNTYHGADGFSVFLFDANAPTFRIGGFGGSLGYANHNNGNQPGLAGAYLGIGIDEYGNFCTTNDGRHGGVGTTTQPNSITLRGSEKNKWAYLTHNQLQTSSSLDGPNSVDYNTTTSTRPNDDTFYRRVKIYIEPVGTNTYRIRVLWKTSPTGADVSLISYDTTEPIPTTLKLGFAASTGGGFNFHEIRNLLITTPGGVRVQKSVDKANAYIGETLTYTVNVHNETTAHLSPIILTDTIKGGNGVPISLNDFEISSITFNNHGFTGNTAAGYTSGTPVTSGFTNPFSVTLAMEKNSQSSFTIVGKVKTMPAGERLMNSVKIDPSQTGISEADTTNNYSTASTIMLKRNYWHGTIDNDWAKMGNWTANFVPLPGEDVEFATLVNNGPSGDGNGAGPAKNDLYLDADRMIGNLINNSDKNLVITTANQLKINGEVKDNNSTSGTIVVKSSSNKPSGTLIFADPSKNQNVGAIVEFYNRAYDCADCGFYTRSWQYFGIPVKNASFPYNNVAGNETVNQWLEPFNGNKWQSAPYAPDTELKAFKGYQMTNSEKTEPTDVYNFSGTLNTGNTLVPLTRTANVNYTGVNLVGNSYTAAIPIKPNVMTFPAGVEQTVYLFNTGTRDEWRKLNGTAINQDGYRSGQYLAVPVNLGGQGNFPDRIPSMHAFMLRALSGTGGNLTINYSQLVKNTTVNRGDGTQIVTRSATSESTTTASVSTLPSLAMDVIGEQSADRVWIFAKEGTTYGFDNGWDGRKMAESGIAQLYVADEAGNDRFQVATVPGLDNVTLGFDADVDGKYTVEFSLSPQLKNSVIYLHDLAKGTKTRVTDGGSYTFEAVKGASPVRFRLTNAGNDGLLSDDEALINVSAPENGKISINNQSGKACTVFISGTNGKLLQKLEVEAGDERVVENLAGGTYVVRLQNAAVNDVRKITME